MLQSSLLLVLPAETLRTSNAKKLSVTVETMQIFWTKKPCDQTNEQPDDPWSPCPFGCSKSF